jgi:cell division protein ZapA
MSDTNNTVSIKLLDREYKIKCPYEKLADLQEAANYLDQKMRESSENKRLNMERIFMIAALNVTNELVNLRRQKIDYIDNINQRIQELQNKIDQALAQ